MLQIIGDVFQDLSIAYTFNILRVSAHHRGVSMKSSLPFALFLLAIVIFLVSLFTALATSNRIDVASWHGMPWTLILWIAMTFAQCLLATLVVWVIYPTLDGTEQEGDL